MSIAENVAQVQERIDRAAKRSQRRVEDITLVAVSKTVSVDLIEEAVEAGIEHLGENRVQEAAAKHPLLEALPVHWHLVGHLQRNKTKRALSIFDLFHSVDSARLLEAIDRNAVAANRTVDVLVQVNTSGEASKYGLEPSAVMPLIEVAGDCQHVRVRGLMTIGPLMGGPEAARASFRNLRHIADEIAQRDHPQAQMDQLSMGMTGDFEVAIEEGATMVRIGTAIFGRRDT